SRRGGDDPAESERRSEPGRAGQALVHERLALLARLQGGGGRVAEELPHQGADREGEDDARPDRRSRARHRPAARLRELVLLLPPVQAAHRAHDRRVSAPRSETQESAYACVGECIERARATRFDALMALNPEWRRRIEYWQKTIAQLFYRPLATVPLKVF